MTPEEASSLAARTLAAIPRASQAHHAHRIADRARVASDLAGLTEVWTLGVLDGEGRNHTYPGGLAARYADGLRRTAARYADGLIRTAALYGVTP